MAISPMSTPSITSTRTTKKCILPVPMIYPKAKRTTSSGTGTTAFASIDTKKIPTYESAVNWFTMISVSDIYSVYLNYMILGNMSKIDN